MLFMKDAVHPLKQQKPRPQSGMTLGLLVRALIDRQLNPINKRQTNGSASE